MITLSKLRSVKIKKHFFLSILIEVKVFSKRKFEKKSKIQNASFSNSFQLIVAFFDVFRGYSNAALG